MNPEFKHLEQTEAELLAEAKEHRKDLLDDFRMTTCDKCAAVYGIGDSPFCRDLHAPIGRTYHEFESYFDYGLGEEILTRDQRRQMLRKEKAYARDGMRAGDLSARKDRVEADRAERRREKPTGKLYF